jgi:PPM family protein phosphatase
LSRLRFQWDSRSEIAGRPSNEDTVVVGERLVAVADGVGGQAAGEVASRLAANALVKLTACYLDEPLEDALADAIREGNETIAFVERCRPHFAGMATTVSSAAISDEGEYVVANIGDSRTYLFREGRLSRLTRDDTLVQRLIDAGEISDSDARRHPQRSIVLNALDGRPGRAPAVSTVAAREGDRLLVCSDGLTDVVDDTVIARALAVRDRRVCSRKLVAAAIRSGGSDNVSVVVADVEAGSVRDAGWRRRT